MQELIEVTKDIERKITKELDRVGLMYRIFSRTKTENSIETKIKRKNYVVGEKMLQDSIGFRITLYFKDDISVTQQIIKSLFTLVNEEVDLHEDDQFKPQRINFVFKAPDKDDAFNDVKRKYEVIDDTFEVQLRTVLAEGWHEIDHDLRYKCSDDWEGKSEYSRTLNGLNATLETCDWSLLNLFDNMSYTFYKERKWEAMLRHKFRMRLLIEPLSEELTRIFNSDVNLAKKFFRTNRVSLMKELRERKIQVPLNLSNLVYLVNLLQVRNAEISNITPELIRDRVTTDS